MQQPVINSRRLIGAGVAAVVFLLVLVGSCDDGDKQTASSTTTVTRTVTATPAPVTITVTESAGPPPEPSVIDQPPQDVPLLPPTTTTSTYAPVPLVPQMPTGAYYSNCAEARRAGAAPLYAGQPGYRAALDRDGDGVACE